MRRALSLAAALCVLLSLTACSAEQMKGTPFYTGEYERNVGSAAGRVNLWPAFYYRDPALSVLWPFGEYVKGEHFAVRPFFSMYDLGKKQRRYYVLWPLSGFEPARDTYWAFPCFWGRSGGQPYFTAFPLYWSLREHYVGLFPLFLYYYGQNDRALHLLWPLIRWKPEGESRGWRFWPFFGRSRDSAGSAWWALWPLIRSWHSTDGNEAVRWAAPFYFGGRSPRKQWDLAVPLFWRSAAGDKRTLITPVYGSYSSGDLRWRYAAPLYFDSEQGEVKQQLLFPFFYRWTDGDARMLLTLPYGFHESGRTKTILSLPLLSAYTKSPEAKDLWALFPLANWRWDDAGLSRSHVFPLYYWSRADDIFVSLPISFQGDSDEGFLNILGLLAHHAWDGDEHRLFALFPLTGWWWDDDGFRGSYVFPLYFWSRPDKLFATIPFSLRRDPEDGFLNILLGLFHHSWRNDAHTLWLPWPFGRFEWGREDSRKSWFWPLYSYERKGERKHYQFGPFLGDASLAGSRSSENESKWWVVPLYSERSQRPVRWREGNTEMEAQQTVRSFMAFPFVFSRQSAIDLSTAYAVGDVSKQMLNIQEQQPARERSLTVFPLFSRRTEGDVEDPDGPGGNASFSLLWRLYDSRRELTPAEGEAESELYVRRRILWRLMHYERVNDETSLDVFPGITWDRLEQGTTFSFLWRVFRYERKPDGDRKVYVFFIPFG